jgi:hypothetical protein
MRYKIMTEHIRHYCGANIPIYSFRLFRNAQDAIAFHNLEGKPKDNGYYLDTNIIGDIDLVKVYTKIPSMEIETLSDLITTADMYYYELERKNNVTID